MYSNGGIGGIELQAKRCLKIFRLVLTNLIFSNSVLPNEIGLQILQDCDLESCLAFSESLSSINALLRSLDTTLLREKLLERVPWMELDESDEAFRTWLACARVVRARNRATRIPDSKWTSASDFNTLFPLCKPKEVFVDPVNVDGALSESFTPVFKSSNIGNDPGISLKGDSIHFKGGTVNVKSLKVDYNSNEEPPIERDQTTTLTINGEEEECTVISSNGTVAHVRSFAGVLPNDYLVYDNNLPISLPSFETFCEPFVHLLPNKFTKALVGIHVKSDDYSETLHREEKTWVYLVDTLDRSKMALVTVLPARPIQWSELLRENWMDEVMKMVPSRDFDVAFYHGLLHIYCKGRLVPLWIDCGLEDDDNSTGFACRHDCELSSYPRTRVRTWFNTNKPVICTVPGYLPNPRYDSKLVREGRYITLSGTEGRLVGDLETNTSYIVRDMLRSNSFVFPGLCNGQPVFYRWKRTTLRDIVGLLEDEQENEGLTERIAKRLGASKWTKADCSDEATRLGVYRNWAEIARRGFKFNMRDIIFMAPNLVLKSMDHHER